MTVKGKALINRGDTRPFYEAEKFSPGERSLDFRGTSLDAAELLTRIEASYTAYLVVRAHPKAPFTDLRIDLLVNPESFSESVSANYTKHAVYGLSHEVAQYKQTASRMLNVDFFIAWDIYIQKGIVDVAMTPMDFRNSLESLIVPAGPRLGPPRVEFHWPGADIDFSGVVVSLNTKYERFSSLGFPIQYTMSASFLEVPEGLMTTSRVNTYGIGWNSAEGY